MKNSTPHFSIYLTFLFFSFLGINNVFAQPANDLCSGAIPLTVNGACTNGTNVGATTTAATDGAMGCWGTAQDNTVWYQFTTGATPNTYVISTDNGGSTDTQIKLFTSACTGTLAPGTNCNDDGGSVNAFASVITTSALAPSTTYYVEVDVYGTGATGTFCISVATLPDICSGAITLVAGAPCTGGTNVGSSTAGDGAGVGAASCWTGASAYSNSVFYNFVATNDSMTISFGNGSLLANQFGPYGAVYSGSCGSLVQLPPASCVINGNDINATGLTVGNTYYIMVDGNSTNTGTFCISVSSSLPGNNNLVPLVNTSGCGLNFVQASNRVTSRSTGLAGTGLPTTLAISGLPATCRIIDKAYLLYEVSYTAGSPMTSPGVTVVNPAAASFPYSASLVGRSHQKCWGEMGTASYRTDVTSCITGNGNYVVNTTYSASEIDGMTLLIIYRDVNATYQGHLLIDNGIITINDFSTAAHTITGVNACSASTGTSFLIAGDFQFATHTNTATGASTTVPVDNFWNFDQASTTYTLGQPSISFTSASNYIATADCFSLIATGAYYQTTTCTTCNLPLSVSITPTQPTCGLNNGSATANPSTGIYAPYTYSWSPGGMTTQTVTGLAPGTYTVTVTDPTGCKTATNTVTINSSSAVNASVTPSSTTICSGGSTTLTASGGGTYSWNTGPTTAAITVSPASTTTYTVTVTVGVCTGTATSTVTVNPAPVATFSYTGSPYCQSAANPSPTFSGGGVAGTFSSTAGLVFVSTSTGQVNLSASTPGTYTVTNTIAASGGCPAVTATASITITAPQVATFSYTGSPYCQSAANPSPTFSGGGVAGTFSSTAGLVFVSTSTGQVNLSASTPGTYTVTNTIAASGGCPAVTATASITITAPQVATFSYTGTPYCQSAANPSPTFSGGGVAGTFSSTAGLVFVSTSTGQVNLSASTPGTYTVTNTIAASGGCPAVTATASITINPSPVATFSYTGTPYCQSATNPSPTFSGGGVAGTFSSTAGLVFVSTSTGQVNLSASTPGTYTVTNTIAASGGCPTVTATASITITAPQVATFSYTGSPYCQSAANPSPTFSGGGAAGTFSSTAGLSINAGTGVVNLAASTPGTYTVTNTIAASGGCPTVTATASITITAPQVATFSYTGTPYCQSAANPSPTFSGGGVAGTFSSTAGLVFVSTSAGQVNLSASTPGTYTVTNTIAASGGCPAVTATASITINPSPLATFSYTGSPYCQSAANPSPTFSGGGVAGTFSSSAGLVFVSTSTGQVNLSASTPGTYTVTNTIAASGGCPAVTATSSITITTPQAATFSYTGSPYCQGAANPSPTFSGGGVAGTFSSTAGLVFVSTSTGQVNLSASTPGTYTVTNTIAASGGCPAVTATASITITTPQAATFSYTGSPYCQSAANPSPTFSGGGVAGTFSSSVGLVFVSTSTGQVNLSASTPGTYTVTNTIAASGGCPAVTATASITINPVQNAAFNYSSSTFCQTGSNPTPTITGTPGGTFTSSPAGLVFVSTSTGEINLAASTLNTFTITYTTAGPCANSATATITITTAPVATFSYTGTPYCQNASNPSPTFSGGGTAGVFSSTGGLVFVSTATGQVNLSASTPGTYTITNTIAASGGCSAATATASITINPVQNSGFNYSSPTFCQTGANPTPTITGVAGGTFTSSPAGLVFVSSSTGQINLSASTLNTYTITYTTAGPCPSSSTASITISNPTSAVMNYGGPYCQSAANPSPTYAAGASAGVFSSTAGLVFVSTSTGQVNLSASTPGTYVITNTIAASGGCPASTDTAGITITAPQAATFSYTGTPYCQSAVNPSPTFSGGGVAGIFSSTAGLVFVSTSTGQINLSASTPGTYTVTNTIAASGGCPSVTATSSITITAPQVATFSYTGSPYCQSAANPSPTFSGSGTAGVFSSTAGLVFVSTATGQVDLTASTPGTYTVTNTIAASGGCAATTATASITINPVQNAAFNYSSSTFCQTGANPIPTITGTPGGTFTSSPAGLVFVSTSTGEINLAASTLNTFTITYTTAGPCANSSTATVTITTAPVATFSYTGTPYCQNASNPSPTFSGSGTAGVFSSTAGLVFVSTATGQVDLTASTPGTYTVTNTIAASGGCAAATATASITINPLQNAAFNYSSSTFCQSGANPIPAITGVAGGTFTSSPAGLVFVSTSTGEINLAASTLNTFTITYTTAGPCANSSTAIVTITTAPVATFSYTGTPYCQSGTNPFPTFSGGGTAGTFTSTVGLVFVSSSTGQVDLTASTPGTYTVTNTIAASGGCAAATATASITINPLQNASFNYSSSTFCHSGANPIPAITGVAGGTFTSSPAGLVFVSTSTGEINLAASTLNTFTITYTTAGPCANSSTATVTITSAPAATFSFTGTPYCQSAADPSPTFSGGGSAGTFTSTAGLVFVSSATGQVNLSSSTPGTYTITNTIAASGGCPASTATATITITAPQTASFSYTGSPYCQSAANPSPTFSGGGIAGTFTSTAGLSINASTGVVNLASSTAGTYTVTNTIAPSGGCPAVSATVTITINPLQNASFNYSSPTFCQSGTNPIPTITGAAGGTFTSSPAGLVFVNASTGEINLTASSLNTFTITYTTPGPCANSSTATVTIVTSPTAAAAGTNVCAGQTINLTATGGGTYSWTGPATFTSSSQNPSVSGASIANSGTYTVTVNSGGCTDTAQIAVVVNPSLTVSAGTDVTINQGASTTLTASGGTTYNWHPATGLSCTNCASPSASPLQTTVYCVVASNGSCSDSSCVTVTVETPCPSNKDLAVPSAFSPNDDGNNDQFCLQGWNSCMAEFTIYIYDRWGEKVFQSSDASFCWDGIYRGKVLDPAVFVYFIKATMVNGDNIEKKGNISIIR